MRRRTLSLAVAAAALAGTAALAAVAVSGGAERRLAPPGGDPVLLETVVSPARVLFGDRLLAEIRLTVDAVRADPGSVVAVPVFRPFRRVGPVRLLRTDLGDTTVLRFLYPIQCVDRGCALRGAERELALPLGLVRYTRREGDIVTLPLEFPPVTVSSRLPAETRRDLAVRPAVLGADAALSEPAPLALRGGASLLGWLLVGAAGALVLGAGGWLARRLRPRPQAAGEARPAPEPAPLAAALAALEAALSEGEAERRVALDLLARRLSEAGAGDLAREARRAAWSREAPDRGRAAGLAARARARAEEAA